MVAGGLLAGASFALLIEALPRPPVFLHELAGVTLLADVVAALLLSWRARREEPGVVGRLVAALGALVVMGALGAALSVGLIAASLDQLPVVALGVFLLLLVDVLRRGLRKAPGPPRQLSGRAHAEPAAPLKP